ncbi:MAG: PKD domain-containing protein [Chloroflexi bacterium]|nr:MAG: PKD domain-containing protein [Chloroflexota bacterium]
MPNLHTLARSNALLDAYSTGTQPPSGPNHWWLFSGQSASSSQQQSYPAATGTQFDRFLKGPGGGYPFVMNGDFYWMLNNGSGYWRNPATNAVEVLPVNRPGTSIPEEINFNHFTCCGQNDDDQTIASDFESFVTANGLPDYSYVELFNDHPGTFQDIPKNDAVTKQVVDFIMGNAAFKDNTMIVVTEDDTQNGNNGPDHVSNTFRVPMVVVASPTFMKTGFVSHVAYTTNNVLAAMERVMENNHPGVIDPNDAIGLSTFPMTTNDQAGLGDPLEDLWIQGTTPLSARASATPLTGNAPLNVSFTGSVTGGKAPYSFSWSFGDGSSASTTQSPTHTYTAAGNFTATLTVTDASSPVKTTTSSVAVTVSAVGNPLAATVSATPTSGQIPLGIAFSGTGTGGTPPYSFSWNFGDGSATSTAQNPSHTYNTAGTFTATLTVSDSASPVKTASANVSITATPVMGTPPGAPTGLTATGGSGQVALSWTAPASNGGVDVNAYRVYRGTSSGSETLLTTGGCSGLGNVLSCTDTGLTNGQTYFYRVSAVNAIGEGAQSTETSVRPGGCAASQLLGNPGFETGTAAPWSASTGVVSNHSQEPPRSGTWDAWMDGYGTTHTDTLSQNVSIPSSCANANLSFWLHVDTAETTTTARFDTLQVQVLNSSGTVLGTLATYSNLDHNTGYAQRTFSLSPYVGQTITVKLTGAEDFEKQTSFVVDDAAINVRSRGLAPGRDVCGQGHGGRVGRERPGRGVRGYGDGRSIGRQRPGERGRGRARPGGRHGQRHCERHPEQRSDDVDGTNVTHGWDSSAMCRSRPAGGESTATCVCSLFRRRPGDHGHPYSATRTFTAAGCTGRRPGRGTLLGRDHHPPQRPVRVRAQRRPQPDGRRAAGAPRRRPGRGAVGRQRAGGRDQPRGGRGDGGAGRRPEPGVPQAADRPVRAGGRRGRHDGLRGRLHHLSGQAVRGLAGRAGLTARSARVIQNSTRWRGTPTVERVAAGDLV